MESRGSILGIHADWQAIALCILAAGTFWFLNAMNDDHTADIAYPVEFVYNDKKMIPVEPLPTKIHFNASGFGWNLFQKTLHIKRPSIVINLDDLRSYKFLTAKDILPVLKSQMEDVKINYISQDTLFFNFDRLGSRTFPLQLDTVKLSLAQGYKINGKVKILPERIKVIGPSKVLKALNDSMFRVHLTERNIQSDVKEKVNLEFDLPKHVETEPKEGQVAFKVQRFIVESLDLELSARNFPANKSLPDLEKVELTVLIKPEDIEKFKNEDFKAVLNYKRLSNSSIPVKLQHKPDYVRSYYFTPAEVKIEK